MNPEEWFVGPADGGETAGPISGAELIQRIKDGRVRPDDLIWCDGMNGWQKAEAFAWLLEP
jgi:hypothetical protein